ncbi:MAG: 50S ribosomal protein L3 [Rickettsiales bacterium]|jgi:large subunit ribosomal protein L3|nr:50S ribosomal protein L3 [Rickettsiales bacterium]
MKRSGLITEKVGMTRLYDAAGVSTPVTVLAVKDCTCVGQRTIATNGYVAVQLGLNEAKDKHMSKPELGHCKKQGVRPFRKVSEFRVSEDCLIPVGTKMSAGHFVAGQFIDAEGVSKGKGFAGAIKRHNFGGDCATHGVLKAHRSLGGTGMREWPGRVFKGKRMAGQMGAEKVSVQNLKVFGCDLEDNLLFIEGAVPGAKGSYIIVADAVKKEMPKDLPMPTLMKKVETAPVIEESPVAEVAAEEKVGE